MKVLKKIVSDIRESVSDDSVRMKLQFLWLYRILGVVSFGMTIVNIITAKYLLMTATLVFALTCVFNSWLGNRNEKGRKISELLFVIEIFILFTFFIIAGSPEGFSAIWICLLPFGGLLMFGRRNGSILCAIMLLIIIFCYWIPLGVSWLQYDYTDSFKLRFPLLYTAFYMVSLFLETIRGMTQKQLLEVQQKYQYFYLHDALTGIYNRYGFNELMDKKVSAGSPEGLALMILDIDYFKRVNDNYGHVVGDQVLKEVARKLTSMLYEKGEVCRWGGEEFAVLIPHRIGAEKVAEQLRMGIEQLIINVEKDHISVTISIGMAVVNEGETANIDELIKNADKCLYLAKTEGRNQIVVNKSNSWS